jgi:hypothetical protein
MSDTSSYWIFLFFIRNAEVRGSWVCLRNFLGRWIEKRSLASMKDGPLIWHIGPRAEPVGGQKNMDVSCRKILSTQFFSGPYHIGYQGFMKALDIIAPCTKRMT